MTTIKEQAILAFAAELTVKLIVVDVNGNNRAFYTMIAANETKRDELPGMLKDLKALRSSIGLIKAKSRAEVVVFAIASILMLANQTLPTRNS